MSLQKKTLLNILLFIGCLAMAASAILYNYSYKMCWKCSTQNYYERGKEFVCRDKVELQQTGVDFLRLAADKQQADAQILLAECYLGGLPEGYISLDGNAFDCLKNQLRPNATVAKQFFNLAYDTLRQGELTNNKQLFNFALLVENGILNSDNQQQDAHNLYLQAAEHGNNIAMTTLGFDYHKKSDYVAAKKWLRLAAEAGNDAQPALILGDYFFYGKGETVNYEKAIHWYRLALKTQKSIWARASEGERITAQDAPIARIEMAMRQLQKTRMLAPMSLNYRIAGNANHYIIHSEDRPEGAIGSVKKTKTGITAQIDEGITLALSIPIRSKVFESMNDGMEWLLHAYARSRYGSYAKVSFILKQ